VTSHAVVECLSRLVTVSGGERLNANAPIYVVRISGSVRRLRLDVIDDVFGASGSVSVSVAVASFSWLLPLRRRCRGCVVRCLANRIGVVRVAYSSTTVAGHAAHDVISGDLTTKATRLYAVALEIDGGQFVGRLTVRPVSELANRRHELASLADKRRLLKHSPTTSTAARDR